MFNLDWDKCLNNPKPLRKVKVGDVSLPCEHLLFDSKLRFYAVFKKPAVYSKEYDCLIDWFFNCPACHAKLS